MDFLLKWVKIHQIWGFFEAGERHKRKLKSGWQPLVLNLYFWPRQKSQNFPKQPKKRRLKPPERFRGGKKSRKVNKKKNQINKYNKINRN